MDLDRLFEAASANEIELVKQQWRERKVQIEGYRVELEREWGNRTIRVFSHIVDGHRHFAALTMPRGAGPQSLPLVVVAHGGDDGIDLGEYLMRLQHAPLLLRHAAVAFPSFRSESLRTPVGNYVSEGAPSPWDRDVDDVLGVAGVLTRYEDAVDGSRVAIVGFSRGGLVALLAAARTPTIQSVVEYFAPTDFFDAYVSDAARAVMEDGLVDLPGATELADAVLFPLRRGELSLEEARLELVRRSAVLFAERLPPAQIHHGSLDASVDVRQALRLDAALREAGRDPNSRAYQLYIYENGEHDPMTLGGSFRRTTEFLNLHLNIHGSRVGARTHHQSGRNGKRMG